MVTDKEVTSLTDVADIIAENFSEVSFSCYCNAKFQSREAVTERHPVMSLKSITLSLQWMNYWTPTKSKSNDSAVCLDDIHCCVFLFDYYLYSII